MQALNTIVPISRRVEFIRPTRVIGNNEDTLCQETSGREHHSLRASAYGIAIVNLLVE
jgi:hypothetical protein